MGDREDYSRIYGKLKDYIEEFKQPYEEEAEEKNRRIEDFESRRKKVWDEFVREIESHSVRKETAEKIRKYSLGGRMVEAYLKLLRDAKKFHIDGEFLGSEMVAYYKVTDLSRMIGPKDLEPSSAYERFENSYEQALHKLKVAAEIKPLLNQEEKDFVSEVFAPVEMSDDLEEDISNCLGSQEKLMRVIARAVEGIKTLMTDGFYEAMPFQTPFRGDLHEVIGELEEERNNFVGEIEAARRERENLGIGEEKGKDMRER